MGAPEPTAPRLQGEGRGAWALTPPGPGLTRESCLSAKFPGGGVPADVLGAALWEAEAVTLSTLPSPMPVLRGLSQFSRFICAAKSSRKQQYFCSGDGFVAGLPR